MTIYMTIDISYALGWVAKSLEDAQDFITHI